MKKRGSWLLYSLPFRFFSLLYILNNISWIFIFVVKKVDKSVSKKESTSKKSKETPVKKSESTKHESKKTKLSNDKSGESSPVAVKNKETNELTVDVNMQTPPPAQQNVNNNNTNNTTLLQASQSSPLSSKSNIQTSHVVPRAPVLSASDATNSFIRGVNTVF